MVGDEIDRADVRLIFFSESLSVMQNKKQGSHWEDIYNKCGYFQTDMVLEI